MSNRWRAEVRLLWDELLSHSVPRALRELGVRATFVGSPTDSGVPPRGSYDDEVIAFASRTNQVIVTSNHDMMTLCEESGQRFVWLDPHGRQVHGDEQVVLVFTQIREWDRNLQSDPDICVRAMRTKCVPITAADAARLARNRMVQLDRKKRKKRASRVPPADPAQETLGPDAAGTSGDGD